MAGLTGNELWELNSARYKLRVSQKSLANFEQTFIQTSRYLFLLHNRRRKFYTWRIFWWQSKLPPSFCLWRQTIHSKNSRKSITADDKKFIEKVNDSFWEVLFCHEKWKYISINGKIQTQWKYAWRSPMWTPYTRHKVTRCIHKLTAIISRQGDFIFLLIQKHKHLRQWRSSRNPRSTNSPLHQHQQSHQWGTKLVQTSKHPNT